MYLIVFFLAQIKPKYCPALLRVGLVGKFTAELSSRLLILPRTIVHSHKFSTKHFLSLFKNGSVIVHLF